MARIASLNVSPGGVPKRPVARARLGALGLEGDRQRHTRFHGGPRRAVCLYSVELVAALVAEGHPVRPGALGENLTLEGVDLGALAIGARLRLGREAVIEVTSRVEPCRQIAGCFSDGDFARIRPGSGRERLYASVVVEGEVAVGDGVVTERPPASPATPP